MNQTECTLLSSCKTIVIEKGTMNQRIGIKFFFIEPGLASVKEMFKLYTHRFISTEQIC